MRAKEIPFFLRSELKKIWYFLVAISYFGVAAMAGLAVTLLGYFYAGFPWLSTHISSILMLSIFALLIGVYLAWRAESEACDEAEAKLNQAREELQNLKDQFKSEGRRLQNRMQDLIEKANILLHDLEQLQEKNKEANKPLITLVNRLQKTEMEISQYERVLKDPDDDEGITEMARAMDTQEELGKLVDSYTTKYLLWEINIWQNQLFEHISELATFFRHSNRYKENKIQDFILWKMKNLIVEGTLEESINAKSLIYFLNEHIKQLQIEFDALSVQK